MEKRTFIKLSTTLLAMPAIAPLASWVPDKKLKNWAGNLSYSTDRLHPASSVEQVREAVKKYPKLKVLGTRHCFNTIADSTDNLLSLNAMDKVVSLNEKARTVTVDATMKYGQLAPYLDKKGFALHNLASLPHISIAGACATATHGSGVKNGNLSTAVSAMEIVTAAGDVRTVSRANDGDLFRAAVVHLGALGVVTKVTLDMEPTFQMRQYVYENLPIAQLKEHFEAIVSGGYSVSLFTDWQKSRVNEVWIKQRIDKNAGPERGAATYFGATLAKKNLHPIAELSAVNCTEQMGVPGPWYERMPHFRMGFTPSSGTELQSEYFVPRRNAIDAILAVERLRDSISPHLMISELRTIDADNLWLSPCYKQPSLAIHFTWKQDWASVKKVLPLIERELAPFKARPHWGKLFTMAPAQLQSRYEKLAAFKQLVHEYDPKGKFRNAFLDTNLYGS
ncbi:D-arabinono-1,4-lactone oxidase [Spirosoma utsteinense]|uniref:Xylitol oxidase n=1 Tax=Spirosoma utsteinense TaxID=2585773 RepID=A0ABR6W014_9BACT|nr:D-arabinono-1,4-lactone oxidase [Spirosoma utsteinense]MBC3786494.1 xylitol oxidase [Spirosoma utsteinense]MBC3789870.1 xylitol oxidase [Spirosoma utsteinense]